ncbi:YihY/virulence factor BrkB family protein [Ahrensia kielensis]|uniref:YihY/virulence factor BrkB family protein n=1 Tax=Ahrensia kielensis TaxID=76980 RepID=UPI0003731D8E|nr:YihY/virulence factor BrkB family protein [Ahrensia kielensis]
MKSKFLKIKRVAFDATKNFIDSDGWALASHVALSTILALFPFLIFATSLATFLGADQFSETAVELIFDTWPESIAKPLAKEVHNVLTVQRGGLLTVSAIAAAVFASNGVEALRVALNRAYRVTETRNYFLLRLQSIAMVLAATVAMLIISFLLVLAPLLVKFAKEIVSYLPWAAQLSLPSDALRFSIVLLLVAAAVAIAHKWLPNRKRRLKSLAPGIIFTMVTWSLAGYSFALYLDSFATYASTYAGLASIMIAMVFLYIIAAIFIFGAQINAATRHLKNQPPPKEEQRNG